MRSDGPNAWGTILETGRSFLNSSWKSVGLGKGGIELELLLLVSLTRSTIRAREAAVQDSEYSVHKMHEKDS